MFITKDDLYKTKYDYNTLKANIYVVSLLDILKTQDLTADFCVKYILNHDFQFTVEDQSISFETVIKYQPHISDIEFIESFIKVTNKKMKRERVDSIEDFESYMNRYF
jgi:hypothetical protein